MGARAQSTAIAPQGTVPATSCAQAHALRPKARMAPSLWAATAPMTTHTAPQTPVLPICVCLPALRPALPLTWMGASVTTTLSASLGTATPLEAPAPALAP